MCPTPIASSGVSSVSGCLTRRLMTHCLFKDTRSLSVSPISNSTHLKSMYAVDVHREPSEVHESPATSRVLLDFSFDAPRGGGSDQFATENHSQPKPVFQSQKPNVVRRRVQSPLRVRSRDTTPLVGAPSTLEQNPFFLHLVVSSTAVHRRVSRDRVILMRLPASLCSFNTTIFTCLFTFLNTLNDR